MALRARGMLFCRHMLAPPLLLEVAIPLLRCLPFFLIIARVRTAPRSGESQRMDMVVRCLLFACALFLIVAIISQLSGSEAFAWFYPVSSRRQSRALSMDIVLFAMSLGVARLPVRSLATYFPTVKGR